MANETAAVKALPARSEISVEDTWRLEDIFANDQEWESEFQEVKNQISGIKDLKANWEKVLILYIKHFNFKISCLSGLESYIHMRICAMTKIQLILFIKD